METSLLRRIELGTTVARAQVRERDASTSNWRAGIPMLRGHGVTLRELLPQDAQALFSLLTTDEVKRFISVPPSAVGGFERFITWSIGERAAGRSVVFGIVPDGFDMAVGLIQVRALEPSFGTAEWGFAMGSAFWGSGLFQTSAELVVDFAFQAMGVHRLEARAAKANGRGNGILRKLGAVPEGTLRKSFLCDGTYVDQTLWSIVDDEWLRARSMAMAATWQARVH
jgi:ribosomal-protein-alanine N-acetyltransferase